MVAFRNRIHFDFSVINATSNSLDGRGKSDEDVLYQKGASFSAKLANDDGGKSMAKSTFALSASQSGSPAGNENGEDESGSEGDSYDYGELEDSNSETQEQKQQSLNLQQQQQQQQQKVNSNDYYISAESINFNSESEGQEQQDVADFKAASTMLPSSVPPLPAEARQGQPPAQPQRPRPHGDPLPGRPRSSEWMWTMARVMAAMTIATAISRTCPSTTMSTIIN